MTTYPSNKQDCQTEPEFNDNWPPLRYDETDPKINLEVVPPPSEETEPAPLPRLELLHQAEQLVSRDRNQDYGDPQINFQRTVDLVKAYLGERRGVDLAPEDIAVIGVLLKIGRLAEDRSKFDSWCDIAGYAAVGWEVIELGKRK